MGHLGGVGERPLQGGTLAGVTSKLDYLQALGVTAVWLSPVFRQRGHLDSYHGYGVQDFLEVDSRFGSRDDLVELVAQAHQRGLRVLLGVIFNHSGANWLYPPGTPGGELKAAYTSGQYPFGEWRGDQGQTLMTITGGEDGVWPSEFQHPDRYTRAGTGSLDASKFPDVDQAEFRRTDFEDLRDFALDARGTLNFLARAYMYWIALTDCDGYRIDVWAALSPSLWPRGSPRHWWREWTYHEPPGFGPFGTAGSPCFDSTHPLYLRTSAITAARARFPVLRYGRQFLRPVSVFGEPFGPARAGELFGWSRILTDEEALCVINANGLAARGADVLVDAQLNLPGSTTTVILNSAQTGGPASPAYPVGSQVPVRRTASGAAYVEIRNVDPSEALVLVNRP